MRKPSCFSSCSQPSPAGTLEARIGWQGTMKPGGRRRFGRTQLGGVRINMAVL